MTRPRPLLFDYPLVEGEWDAVDGDTVDTWAQTERYRRTWMRLRVLGLDAPDDHTPGPGVSYGVKECEWFTSLWAYGRRLRATTRAEDSFGRPLADVYDADTGEHLDTALIRYIRDVLGLPWAYPQP